MEGVWNRGDRVPDTFLAGCSQNSTATLTTCTVSSSVTLIGSTADLNAARATRVCRGILNYTPRIFQCREAR